MYLKHVLGVEDDLSFHPSILTNIRSRTYELPSSQITTLQTGASSLIKSLGYNTFIEHIINGIFQVDILVTHKTDISKQCIIELDGDQHYSPTGELRRKDLCRDYILYALGYSIIRIKNSDWVALSPSDQSSFILSQLSQAFNQ